MGLFYSKTLEQQFFGYVDASYLLDPHKARSQTRYIFTYGNTTISWRSVKQTMMAISSNHSETFAMHEASRECVWLRSMIQLIRKSCGLFYIKNKPTLLYEDNVVCISQVKWGYIKGDRTKHISQKLFYTHEVQNCSEINVQHIRSSDNLVDLFTKTLPTTTLKKVVHQISMH